MTLGPKTMWVKTQGQAYSGHSFLLFCFTQRLRLSWELYPRILSGIFLAHPLMVSTWFCRGLQYDYNSSSVQFSSFQSLSRVRLFATPWIAASQASLSITNSWSSLRFTSIKSVMPLELVIFGVCHLVATVFCIFSVLRLYPLKNKIK